jgi:hypothetical protein
MRRWRGLNGDTGERYARDQSAKTDRKITAMHIASAPVGGVQVLGSAMRQPE